MNNCKWSSQIPFTLNIVIRRFAVKINAHISSNHSIYFHHISCFVQNIVVNSIKIGIIFCPLCKALLLLKFPSDINNIIALLYIFN